MYFISSRLGKNSFFSFLDWSNPGEVIVDRLFAYMFIVNLVIIKDALEKRPRFFRIPVSYMNFGGHATLQRPRHRARG